MGLRRIHGELAGLGVKVAAPTVWEILQANGTGPAPPRTAPAWSQFLRSQADAILACDFFTVDLLNGTPAYVLAVIEHANRRIRILGVTLHPSPPRIRRPLQPAPAPPVPPATTTRRGRPSELAAGLAGSAAESARRRDQRVLPDSVA
jgi:hypothetical protein